MRFLKLCEDRFRGPNACRKCDSIAVRLAEECGTILALEQHQAPALLNRPDVLFLHFGIQQKMPAFSWNRRNETAADLVSVLFEINADGLEMEISDGTISRNVDLLDGHCHHRITTAIATVPGSQARLIQLVVVVGLGGTERRQQLRLLAVDGGAAGMDHGNHLQDPGREVERGRGQRVEPGRLLGAERDVERLEVVVQLRQRARAEDRRCHPRPALHPGQRHASDGRVELPGDTLQLVNDGVGLVVKEARGPHAAVGLHAARVLTRVLAAQDAALEWRPRRHPEAEFPSHRHQLTFDGAFEQRILDLKSDEGRPAAELGDQLRLGHLPRRRVGDAEVAHLAGTHEILERPHRLLDGRVLVPVVQPIEIDVIGLQPAQRLLALGDDRLAAGAAPIGIADVEVAAELGRDHQAVSLVAVTSDVIADDLLRVSLGVEIGGIDEVAAEPEVPVDHRLGLLDAASPAEILAEGHGAEAERAYAQARTAQGDIVVERHRFLLVPRLGAVDGASWYGRSADVLFRVRIVPVRTSLIRNHLPSRVKAEMRKISPWTLWTLNFQFMTSLMADVAPRIRALRLEIKEFLLLSKVDEHPNPADLARALITPKPSVTFMVKRMEALGYLRRELQRDDLRRFRLTLTPSGRRAMEGAREIFDEEFGRRLSRLTQAQRSQLMRIFERMA